MFLRNIFLRAESKRPKKHMYRMFIPGQMNPLSKPSPIPPGSLHIVSIPIGNVKDFSLRALDVLKNCDYVVCLSRDHFRVLMEIIEIPATGRLIQYQSHSEAFLQKLVTMMKQGHSLAYVTLGGTPTFGDPGSALIQTALRNKLKVTSAPGPCSIIAGLTLSGLDYSNGFLFVGYTPAIRSQRITKLKKLLSGQSVVVVFFEVPERMLACLEDMAMLFPGRRVSVIHEVTKVFEAVHSDEVSRLVTFYANAEMYLAREHGECVVCVEAPMTDDASIFSTREVMHHIETLTKNGHTKQGAVSIASGNLGVPTNIVNEIIRKDDEAKSKIDDTTDASRMTAETESPSDVLKSEVTQRRQRRLDLIRRTKEKIRLIRLKAERLKSSREVMTK